MKTERPPVDRRLTVAAWLVAAVTTTLAMGCIVLEIVGPGPAATSADPEASAGGVLFVAIQSIMASAFAILGAVVVSRQPRNPVGWLLVLIGTFFMVIAVSNELYMQVVLNTGDTSGLLAYVVWSGNWAWLFGMVPAFTFLPLLFPTGRPLTPRWRAVVWFAAAGVALSFVGSAFKAGPLDGAPAVDNPLGIDSPAIGIIEGIGAFLLLPALLASFPRWFCGSDAPPEWSASRSSGWLQPRCCSPRSDRVGLGGDAGWPLVLMAMMVVAIAVTVAMLRYRLYDIDVVINRALVYGSLTAMLAAVYLGSVLLLQLVLETTHRRVRAGCRRLDTRHARPSSARLRIRIQAIVDRRFFRRKYDAAQTLERSAPGCATRSTSTPSPHELRAVIAETMQPEHVSLWTRERTP